ncbi:hypothetical protein Tco_1447940 [Tanacetum coccineum]
MTIPFAIVKEESPLFLLFAIHCALCDYRDLQQQLEIDIIDCSLNYHPLSGNTDQLDWSLVGKCSLLMLVSMWEHIPTMRWITVENTRCGELRLGTHLMDSLIFSQRTLQYDVESQEHRFQLEGLGE